MNKRQRFVIIQSMDAYLGAEAAAGLAAEALERSGKRCRGLLLGHRRGPRYFVERAFPLRGGAFPSETRFRELDRIFGGRIIGFYASGDGGRGSSSILRPFAYGKLYLWIAGLSARSRRPVVKPHVIEYDQAFFLSPIPLARRRP
jgi:hypothetical protein